MACRTVAIMVSLGVHHRIAQFLPRPTLQLLFGASVVLLLKLSFSWSVHSVRWQPPMLALLTIAAATASASPPENERAVRASGRGSDHTPRARTTAPAGATATRERAAAGRAIAVPTARRVAAASEAAPTRASARRGARASTATRANAARAPQAAVSMAGAEAVLARAAHQGNSVANKEATFAEKHPPVPFVWDRLGPTENACGIQKCYFPSKLSEPEADGRAGSKVGYLVGWLPGWGGGTRKEYPKWLQTWNFSQGLQTRFGVEHLLLGPPLLASLPDEHAERLNSILVNDQILAGRVKRTAAGRPGAYSAGPHSVQAVRSCPWPSCIMLGCTKAKGSRLQASIEGFIANVPNKIKVIQGLTRSLPLVTAMVKANKCLKYDFQIYLRNDGSVFNFDVDRCFDRLSSGAKHDLETQKSALCRTESEQLLFDTALLQLSERLSR
jgi:hypothetical protein